MHLSLKTPATWANGTSDPVDFGGSAFFGGSGFGSGFFSGGASLVVEAINGPCRDAGRSIARHTGGPAEYELTFPKVARGLRGIVAAVERPGTVRAGTEIELRIPEQRRYL